MTNEVTTKEQNESAKVTQDLLLDYLGTMNKGLTEQQTRQFLAVAGAFGLNPWKREVYAVTYKGKNGTEMSIVTGYETYIKRAEMNPNYDGYDIQFRGSFKRVQSKRKGDYGDYAVTEIVPDGEVSCVCTVYRKDRAHPVVEEVFFDEYDQGKGLWKSKPRTMLKKVAIVSAFRKAFPLDFGGMPYTSDELPDRMGVNGDAAAVPESVPEQAPKRTAGAKGAKAKKAEPVEAEVVEEDPRAAFERWVAQVAARHGDAVVTETLGREGYESVDQVPDDPEKMKAVMVAVQKAVKESK